MSQTEVGIASPQRGPKHELGLALSGGGSRAAAFHCGTVRALERLDLLPRVDVVSTVSGGSIFAAAWAASLVKNETTGTFLTRISRELGRGFYLRAVFNFRFPLIFSPWYTLTQVLANVFSSLAHHLTVGDLPPRPLFCFNTTVLNSGQVGKFTSDGFSTPGLGARQASGSNPTIPCPTLPLSLAAAASAAFPVGLPPVFLKKKRWFPGVSLEGPLKGAKVIALTDGGVLENLGVQTLLKSVRFMTRDIIASDAGTTFSSWRPKRLFTWVRSFFMWLLSGSILERFAEIMNDKENRWMREKLFHTAGAHAPPTIGKRRNVLLVRVANDWEHVMNVDRGRLQELAPTLAPPPRIDTAAVRAALGAHPARTALLDEARASYEKVGMSAAKLNAIGTNFTALSAKQLASLAEHAYWQVLATYALYWESVP